MITKSHDHRSGLVKQVLKLPRVAQWVHINDDLITRQPPCRRRNCKYITASTYLLPSLRHSMLTGTCSNNWNDYGPLHLQQWWEGTCRSTMRCLTAYDSSSSLSTSAMCGLATCHETLGFGFDIFMKECSRRNSDVYNSWWGYAVLQHSAHGDVFTTWNISQHVK
jgi:hypothetical protein